MVVASAEFAKCNKEFTLLATFSVIHCMIKNLSFCALLWFRYWLF